jgi:hypothetical protein
VTRCLEGNCSIQLSYRGAEEREVSNLADGPGSQGVWGRPTDGDPAALTPKVGLPKLGAHLWRA